MDELAEYSGYTGDVPIARDDYRVEDAYVAIDDCDSCECCTDAYCSDERCRGGGCPCTGE